MQPHKIDELFKSAIDSSEETPAFTIWENIEKNLDQHNLVTIKRKYNNLKGIAIALVLLLFSVFLYELQTRNYSGKTGGIVLKKLTGTILQNPLVEANKRIENKNTNDNRLNSPKSSIDQKPDLTEKTLSEIATNKSNSPFSRGNSPVDYHGAGLQGSSNIGNGFKQALNSNNDDNYVRGELQQNNQQIEEQRFVSNNKRALLPVLLIGIDLVNQGNPYVTQFPGLMNVSGANILINSSNHQVSSSISLTKRAPKFSFTSMFSPDYTLRVIKSDWQINREDNKDDIRKSEHYAFSYSFGVLADYNINSHWAIESGLVISRAVINIRPKFIYARPDNLGVIKFKFNSSNGYSYISAKNMTGPAFGDSVSVSGSFSALQYLSVPVTAKYKFGKRKLNFNVVAGAAANFLVKDKIETSLNHAGSHDVEITKDIIGLKPVYYSAIIAAGATYNINKRLAVNISPTARLALTSINKDAPVKSYQSSLGVVAGVQLNF